MRVRWLQRALNNLVNQIEFISKDSPEAAARMADRVLEGVDLLAQFPHIGRAGRVAGTREHIVSGTPFVIVYRVSEGAVEILRVLHQRQEYPDGCSGSDIW